MTANVAFGSKAEVLSSQSDVSFGSDSGHCSMGPTNRKGASTTVPSNSGAATRRVVELAPSGKRSRELRLRKNSPVGSSRFHQSSPVCKKIFVPTWPKSDLKLRPSRTLRGAFRDRHGREVRDAVDAGGAADESAGSRTVKSCGPVVQHFFRRPKIEENA